MTNADLSEYVAMHIAGMSADQICQAMRANNVHVAHIIRLLRLTFGLSLDDAKAVVLRSDASATGQKAEAVI